MVPAKPVLSEEEIERKSKSIIDEFLHINDYKVFFPHFYSVLRHPLPFLPIKLRIIVLALVVNMIAVYYNDGILARIDLKYIFWKRYFMLLHNYSKVEFSY